MENNLFITDLKIEKVRNLKKIEIKLDNDKRKHLIFTGKNGSGKTSVLEAIASYIDNIKTISEYQNYLKIGLDNLQFFRKNNDKISEEETEKKIVGFRKQLSNLSKGIDLLFNVSNKKIADEIDLHPVKYST